MDILLFATNNQNKAKEVEAALKAINFPIKVITNRDLDNPPHVLETGNTFLANAKLKAHQMAEFSNLPTLADDSGLCVDKLNGAPGVYSARYGGEAHNDARNNAKLLAELGGVVKEERTATFHTTMVVSWPGKFDDDLVTEGEIRGEILTSPRGDGTFGYDPLFFVPDKGKTFAEMSVKEKNAISHRGQALRKLVVELPNWWEKMKSQSDQK
ncbi:XTP/dITP diphosphohydrolase [Lactobacillus colini]|uniref:dITP/XTP pyrophosphatase n=1 Tax=Lactobacillus colini TaxID=1819254 RepID=A0ABS4MFY6_9LACO|nr:XTP/dITP diphosphatase [Lactobacillus colini]MBP2058578.1 XTP/dITP diphosphohydrolase [Lactobacillus colini]